MTEVFTLLEQTYKNQYKIENINKKVNILGKIEHQLDQKVTATQQDIQNGKTVVNETLDVVKNTYKNLVETTDSFILRDDELDKLSENVKSLSTEVDKIPTSINKTTDEILDVFRIDKQTNLTQLEEIKNRLQTVSENLVEVSPKAVLSDVEKQLNLSFDELRVTKDERLTAIKRSTAILSDLDVVVDDFKVNIEKQSELVTTFKENIQDLDRVLKETFDKIQKLRPSDVDDELVLENSEDINELFAEIYDTTDTSLDSSDDNNVETNDIELENEQPQKKGFRRFFS